MEEVFGLSTFFITGGAGFLGINLTRYLLSRGHAVVSYDFSESYDYPEASNDKVSIYKGKDCDIRSPDTLIRAMRGSDIVVHCAAALPLYSEHEIYTTDIDGTQNVINAAKKSGVKRIVHISTTAVYGIPDKHPIYESDKLRGVGAYGKAKIEAEKICAGSRDESTTISILRPKSFIGPERLGAFSLLYDWASTGHGFPLIGSGNNKYQLLDVYDLCQAIYLCSCLPASQVNDVFNIGAESFGTMREDWQAVLDRAGFGKKLVPLPKKPAIAALKVLELMKLSPLYKWIYETAGEDSYVSVEKAKEQLGWKPVYSNKAALIRNFEWYLENRDKFQNTSGLDHRHPWKQGVLKMVKLLF
ncbi:MAG: NAD(P)-dependent oxidoreductase [Papillibacter sp.]|jgi:nucleoside-diphosphate-sugar epimerase|nr:NAD(P)-dependent oxidoreductase [Papillibacter sp.]